MFSKQLIGKRQLASGLAACGITLLCASTVMAGHKGAVGDLYVASEFTHSIIQVDSITGAVVGDFVSGLLSPFDARFGPNGNLFVVDLDGGTVTEHDGNTGAFVGTFVSG